MSRIAVLGTNGDPPGIFLRHIASTIAGRPEIDRVVVIPCGPRPGERRRTDDTDRALMADLTFAGLANVEVDLSDLEQSSFTPMNELVDRYQAQGHTVSVIVGSDLVKGGITNAKIATNVNNGGDVLPRRQRLPLLHKIFVIF